MRPPFIIQPKKSPCRFCRREVDTLVASDGPAVILARHLKPTPTRGFCVGSPVCP